MKKLTQEEANLIIEEHILWLKEQKRVSFLDWLKVGFLDWIKGKRRYELSYLDLSGLDFTGACLIGIKFKGSNLAGANFTCSDCRGANFEVANLEGANFEGAKLAGVKLAGVNLSDPVVIECAKGIEK